MLILLTRAVLGAFLRPPQVFREYELTRAALGSPAERAALGVNITPF